jgi:hypothetical protein
MSSSDRSSREEFLHNIPEADGFGHVPAKKDFTATQERLEHRMVRAKRAELDAAKEESKKSAAALNGKSAVGDEKMPSSSEPKLREAMAPATFIKGSKSFGVDFKAYLDIEAGREPKLRAAHAVQRKKSYQRLELKHWYKCILAEFEINSEHALGLDYELVKELLARTAQVFSPVVKHRFGADDTGAYDTLLAKLDGLLATYVAKLLPGLAQGNALKHSNSGVREFISTVAYRYEIAQDLFKDLRAGYPGYDTVQEAYLYLSWLALACTGGNVKALSDMANFFYAHCHVVSNVDLDLSGYGECFELAQKIKPEGLVNKNAVLKNKLSNKARDRARYLLGRATSSLFTNSSDMQESDLLSFEFVMGLAHILDGINVFDEIACEVDRNPGDYPGFEVPGDTNGAVEVNGELLCLLNTNNRVLLAEEATAALNRFMQNFSGTFVGLGFEGVVNAYYEHLTSSTASLPSTLLIETAMLSVIAQQKIAKRVASERPGKTVKLGNDELLDEYANILVDVSCETLSKLIYIFKVSSQNIAAFDMRKNNELATEGGATNFQKMNFTSALSVVVMDYFVGIENSGLKDLVALLAADVDRGNEIQEAQLFRLSVLYGHYKRPIEKGDGALASVMLGLSRKKIHNIAQNFSVVVGPENWPEFIAATVAAVKKHFVGDDALVVSEENVQNLKDYIAGLQSEFDVVNAMANVMSGVEITTIVAIAKRLSVDLPALEGVVVENESRQMSEYARAWKNFSAALDKCCIDVNGSTPIRRHEVKVPDALISNQASTVPPGINTYFPARSETVLAADGRGDVFYDESSPLFLGGHSDTALVDALYGDIRTTFGNRVSGGQPQYATSASGYAAQVKANTSRWPNFGFGGTSRLTQESDAADADKRPSVLSVMWKSATGGNKDEKAPRGDSFNVVI